MISKQIAVFCLHRQSKSVREPIQILFTHVYFCWNLPSFKESIDALLTDAGKHSPHQPISVNQNSNQQGRLPLIIFISLPPTGPLVHCCLRISLTIKFLVNSLKCSVLGYDPYNMTQFTHCFNCKCILRLFHLGMCHHRIPNEFTGTMLTMIKFTGLCLKLMTTVSSFSIIQYKEATMCALIR